MSSPSLRSRLDRVDLSDVASPAADAMQAAPARPVRTAIGMHVNQVYQDRDVYNENKRLKSAIEAYDGALITRRILPMDVVPSKWANRHELSFAGTEFSEFLAEIESSGGNTQPIKVRPIAGDTKFEIVFGHRRHRACLQLNLPVLAFIEEVSDRDLFVQMERENRLRADPRPFELGKMYAEALNSGLYVSLRKMASELGLDHSSVSKLIALARLPDRIIAAFQNPLDIQFAWGYRLSNALQKNPDAVLAVANEIIEFRQNGGIVSAAKAFKQMMDAAEVDPVFKSAPVTLSGIDGTSAVITYKARGAAIVLDGLHKDRRAELEALIAEFLRGGDPITT